MKRARSYAEERSTTTDSTSALDYPLYRCERYPDIIRAPTRSAHVGRRTYNPTIRFDQETVLDWWCDCGSGGRYIGCCSHVASVIWFLSFQRWQAQSRRMGSSNFINLFIDAGVLPEPIESSTESDDDGSSGEDGDEHEEDGSWCFAPWANTFFILLWFFVTFYCLSSQNERIFFSTCTSQRNPLASLNRWISFNNIKTRSLRLMLETSTCIISNQRRGKSICQLPIILLTWFISDSFWLLRARSVSNCLFLNSFRCAKEHPSWWFSDLQRITHLSPLLYATRTLPDLTRQVFFCPLYKTASD